MALNSSDVGLMAVQKFLDVLRSGKTKSLVEYTSNFRAEPFVMLDSECVFIDEMYDVMQSLQSQYAAYYLLAMSAMTTIGNIQVSQHMQKLNPSRSAVEAAASTAAGVGGLMFAAESFDKSLPSMEAFDGSMVAKLMGNDPRKPAEGDVNTLTAGAGKDAVKEIRELSNLSVGKVITCDISDGGHTVAVPLAIRLVASSLPSESLVHILSGGEVDRGFIERWHGWRSGRLSIMDMLFCNDLIEANYRRGIQDSDGIQRHIAARRRGNSFSSVLSGNISVGTYSNMAVITETTAKELELAMKGKSLKDFKAREELFDNTALMILAIVDRNWKRVTFYHQSLTRPLEVSFRDLKASNKGSGPDVAEILNAYRLGTTPVL